MKPNRKNAIKNSMAQDFVRFINRLYGQPLKNANAVKTSLDQIYALVDAAEKHKLEDYDLLVYLTACYTKSKSNDIQKEEFKPKTLLSAIDEGYSISEDVTLIDVEIRPVVYNQGKTTYFESKVYSKRIFLGNNKVSYRYAKKKYGLTDDDLLLPVDELKDSKIFKFYKKQATLEV